MKVNITSKLKLAVIPAVVVLMMIAAVACDLSFCVDNVYAEEVTPAETTDPETPDDEQPELEQKPVVVVEPPKKTKIKSLASKKEKQVAVKWKKIDCVGYQLAYARNKNFTKSAGTVSFKKDTNKYTFTNLAKGKKYYFRVRAYNTMIKSKGKKKKIYGEWSDVKSIVVHKHKYVLSYLKPIKGVEYVEAHTCSCGAAYYKSKTNKGKIYNGIVTRMPSCITGVVKSSPNGSSQYIPAVSTHTYVEQNGKSVCSKCGQLLNYINTEYVDQENETSTNVVFTAPKNTNLSTSISLSVNNQAGEDLKYKLYYQKSSTLYYKYPKYRSYLKSHGCSTCALTTVLNATVPKYKNYTPDMVIEKVIRPVVGEKTFNANFSKTLSRQMPIGLKGIAKVLEANGVPYKYVYKYTQKSAAKEIKAHLKSGNPVIFTVPKSVYSSGVHTMCMLSLDKNGRVIVGDSCHGSAKKWGKNNRLIKFNTTSSAKSSKVSKVCKYFNASTKSVASVKDFYSGRKGNIGYILVWKNAPQEQEEPQEQK